MRIRNRIFAYISPLLVIALVAVGVAGYLNMVASLETKVRDHLQALAAIQEQRIAERFVRNVERINLLASRTALRRNLAGFLADGDPGRRDEIREILDDALRSVVGFEMLLVARTDGRVVSSTDARWAGESIADTNFFTAGMRQPQGHAIWRDDRGRELNAISAPLTRDGEFLGVMVLFADFSVFGHLLRDYTGLGETGETLLVAPGADGAVKFLVQPRFGALAGRAPEYPRPGELARMASRGIETYVSEAIDYRGEPVYAVTRTLEHVGWGLIVKIDRSEARAELENFRNATMLVVLLGLVLIGAVLYLVSNAISRPITQLSDAALEIDLGSGRAKFEQGNSEIDVLTEAINHMAWSFIDFNERLQDEIRHRTEVESELRESQERFNLAVKGSSDGLWDWPCVTQDEMWWSDRFYQLLGFASGEIPASQTSFYARVHEDDRQRIADAMERHLHHKEPYHAEFRVQLKDGSYHWVASRGAALRDEHGEAVRVSGSLQDIQQRVEADAELQRLMQELENQAATDPLTSLPNRRRFEEQIEKEMKRAKRQKVPLSLVVIDADHFKAVNDTHGHTTGDLVLKELSACMRSVIREVDLPCRFGGEEFLLALPDTDETGSSVVAERLRAAAARMELHNEAGEAFRITCSLGVAEWDHQGSLEDLINHADKAVYAAKEGGRNQVRLASELDD